MADEHSPKFMASKYMAQIRHLILFKPLLFWRAGSVSHMACDVLGDNRARQNLPLMNLMTVMCA